MKIFISYRRDDSAGYAGRLFDHLSARFGTQHVFMDIDTIKPGEDFRNAIETAVGTCDVVLVMIGRQWVSATDPQGQRRLDDPGDWVRAEIATALRNKKVVIPVLVHGTSMPRAHELPDDLKDLAYRNAIELSDKRFQYDANQLIGRIAGLGIQPAPPPDPPKPRIGVARLGAFLLVLAGLGLLLWLARSFIMPGAAPELPTATATEALVTPSPTNEVPTSTTAAENTVPRAVQAVHEYFRYINDAGIDDDLERAWDLMTANLQNNPSDQGRFETYRDWWWKEQVRYKLYDCGSNTVAAELLYYTRNTTPDRSKTPVYMLYELVEENGQLKLNHASSKTGISAYCEFIPVTPVPVIAKIELTGKEGDAPNQTIYAEVHFTDLDGNTNLLKYELVNSTVSASSLRHANERIDATGAEQRVGATHRIGWECAGTYTATFNIVIHDADGNESEKSPVTFDCR